MALDHRVASHLGVLSREEGDLSGAFVPAFGRFDAGPLFGALGVFVGRVGKGPSPMP